MKETLPRAEYLKQYRLDHKEYYKEYYKEYSKTHPRIEYKKQYRLDHKEEISEYDKTHPRIEYYKKYYQDHKKEKTEYSKEYQKKRREEEPEYKLRKNVSSIIYQALKRSNGSKQGESFMQYLPYTIEELKIHLEQQFEPWMSWSNYGTYNSKNIKIENDQSTWRWHVDHIIPQSKLLYHTMEHPNFLKCWSLDNLRPLEAIANIKKGNR